MSTRVTAMKTAKTARSRRTIADCARSTTREPTRLIPAIPTMIAEVKTLSQPAAASSHEQRSGVAPEGHRDHRAHDHDRGEVPEPGRDADQAAVPEPPSDT